mgnify:CR=1 FL=1
MKDIKSFLNSFLETYQENYLDEENEEIKALFNNITDALTKAEIGDETELLESVFNIMLLQCKMYAVMINNVSMFGNEELIKRCSESIKSIVIDLENE